MQKQQVESCIIKTFDNPPTEKKVPQIVLCGEWLERVGFTPKSSVFIECKTGIITLKTIP